MEGITGHLKAIQVSADLINLGPTLCSPDKEVVLEFYLEIGSSTHRFECVSCCDADKQGTYGACHITSIIAIRVVQWLHSDINFIGRHGRQLDGLTT